MEFCATQAPPDRLAALPTPARPRLDPADVVVPDGYDVDVVVAGLSFPTGMGFADDGTLYILEGGSTWPTRPTMLPRILQLDPGGSLRTFAVDTLGGPRGLSCKDGYVYTSSKGGYRARITRWDRETETLPEWAGPPAYLEQPHSCMTGMNFCRSDAFGHRGELFACEWGTLAPLNSPHEKDLDHGFRVVRVNVKAGTGETFFRNREYGAAYDLQSGGIERPVDCKFSPDGRSLYVLDFGTVRVSKGLMMAYAHTGALWKITRR